MKAHERCRSRNLGAPAAVLVCASLISLSALGTSLVNTSGNNLVLLVLMCVICAVILLGAMFERLVTPLFLAITVTGIAIALLLHTTLNSEYLTGYDIHLEYYLTKLVEARFVWDPSKIPETIPDYANYNSMLSVTILPTMIASLSGMEATWVYKLDFSVIFALVPMILFISYWRMFGKADALCAVFLIMSLSSFFGELPSVGRQEVAEVFLALMILLLMRDGMQARKKWSLFMAFSVGLVVSHYGTTYIFMLIALLGSLIGFTLARTRKLPWRTVMLPLTMFFVLIALSWYIYVPPGGPFQNVVNLSSNIVSRFSSDFFSVNAVDPSTAMALGAGHISLAHDIGRALFLVTTMFVIVGVLLFAKSPQCSNIEYRLLCYGSTVVLGIAVVVPNFASALNMTRIYHLTLLFLAPFCVLGGKAIFGWIWRSVSSVGLRCDTTRIAKISVCAVIVLLFLFQVGFMYEVTGDVVSSIPLSRGKLDKVYLYYSNPSVQDVFSAKWSSNHMDSRSVVLSDTPARMHVLTSYAMLPRDPVLAMLINTSLDLSQHKGVTLYVYLSRLNVIDGIVVGYYGYEWNTRQILPVLGTMNKIYSNGGSTIYARVSY